MVYFFISRILSTIFPPHCYGCGKESFSLCPKCLQNCKKSLDTPAIYITSLYSFRDPLIKKMIHAIKYFHRKDLIRPLTYELAKELYRKEDSQLKTKNFILVPIPMPLLRKYIRGYNQAELIAKILSKECSLSINTRILLRKSAPKRQVMTTTKSERLQNQHNTFKINESVKNLNIILVDDVTTTGATIFEARNLLLKAGASTVQALTIAH